MPDGLPGTRASSGTASRRLATATWTVPHGGTYILLLASKTALMCLVLYVDGSFNKASPDDVLMQLFSRDILHETLGCANDNMLVRAKLDLSPAMLLR